MPEYSDRCRAHITRSIETIEKFALIDIEARSFDSLEGNLGQLRGLIEGLTALGMVGDDNTELLADELVTAARSAQDRVHTAMRLCRRRDHAG